MDIIFFGLLFAVSFAFFLIGYLFQQKTFILAAGVLILFLGFFVSGYGVTYQQPLNETTIYSPGFYEYANASCPGVSDGCCSTNTTIYGNSTKIVGYSTISLASQMNAVPAAFGLLLICIGLFVTISAVLQFWEQRKEGSY